MLSTILIVVLILLLIGALPTWGYSGSWGYGPGGIVGVLLIVVVVLALTRSNLEPRHIAKRNARWTRNPLPRKRKPMDGPRIG